MDPQTQALSVAQFCAAHNLSRATFYNLLKAGHGPVIMKVGKRTLISVEAAQRWRDLMEMPSLSRKRAPTEPIDSKAVALPR
jgi:predicted DNA-binding transcriptional regulator AlpA